MQRSFSRLRSLGSLHWSHQPSAFASATGRRLLHSPPFIPQNLAATSPRTSIMCVGSFPSPQSPFHFRYTPIGMAPVSFPSSPALVQIRGVSSRDRRSKRKQTTPAVSRVKKIKIKPYSSYKLRFREMNDGNIRRWKEGRRHNAHLKSKKSKRRLRKPGIVPPAFARVMRKLAFCA